MSQHTTAIILAAGCGTRMKSSLPKVLHPVAGVPMVTHVVRAALTAGCASVVVVVGPDGHRVRDVVAPRFLKSPLQFVTQQERLGTADAAKVGLGAMDDEASRVVILCGDTPLLSPKSISGLMHASMGHDVAVLTAEVENPHGYGRIIRKGNAILRIVEEADIKNNEGRITEINAGAYACGVDFLRASLAQIDTNNAQGEYYLTDMVAQGAEGKGATVFLVDDKAEAMGINDRVQLAAAERAFRDRYVTQLMHNGVSFVDPSSVWVDADVQVAPGAVIGPGVQLYGATSIGACARIEGPSVLRDTTIAQNAKVYSFCHLERAQIDEGASVGPFARLRPGSIMHEGARVGNFVEMKKSTLGCGAKAGHLTYLGDAHIGAGTNIGAGTITCNYDGVNKYPTIVGPGSFIGSNTTLIAPIKMGAGAYIAAGSTITKDVPSNALAFGRTRQSTREGYASRLRATMEAKASSKKAGDQ